MKRTRSSALLWPACFWLACGASNSGGTGTGAGGFTGSGAANGSGGSLAMGSGGSHAGGIGGSAVQGGCPAAFCSDFAGSPFGPDGTSTVPAGAAQAFSGTPATTGGPCLVEPQDGTLLPKNWLRPRFSWTSTGTGDLYALHVTAPNQTPDLVVYTDKTSWTMPKAMWLALAGHTQNVPITVTVLSAHAGTASTGTTAAFSVASVGVTGNLVYVSGNSGPTAGGLTTLNGFSVGAETVGQVLSCGKVTGVLQCDVDATDWQTVDQGLNPQPVQCIGCHTSTPDGAFISFNNASPWGGVLASGQPDSLGQPPTFRGAGGYKAIVQPWLGMTTYSASHWANGDHIAVASLGGNGAATVDTDQQAGLAWFDLENASALPAGQNPFAALKGTAWNWIYPPTPGKYAAAPSWSHHAANDFLVFTAASNVKSGRLGTGTAHLYQVPYSKAAPQSATPIPGLDDVTNPKYAQYYGSLSFDDAYIVYDQVDAKVAATTHPDLNTTETAGAWDGMYMQPAAELYVTPTAGGPGIRLAANDAANCPGQPVATGMMNNTWGRWSPEVTKYNGSTYYWLVFSSWRQGDKDANGEPIAQLFMTVVVKPDDGPIKTYPAVYLWNQPSNVSNFTPAWDVFKIGNVG
ncbi:MAG TPA: hypothetical protein VHM31_06410 [Polyangia bacterium]|nr:hypothetical protein [Polyangia bacterium]